MIRKLSDRTDLKTAIPLDGPIILIVEPTNVCNFKCRFCPTTIEENGQYKHASKKTMSFDDFKRVIDSAKEGFGHVKMVQLYGFGESLLNKHICDMIRYVKDSKICDSVRLYTNGALLNPKLSRGLAEAFALPGESIIQFSIEHISDEGYKSVSNVDLSYDSLLANIAYFYTRANHDNTYIVCKLINDCVTEQDAIKFKSDFAGLGDSVHVELLEEKTEKLEMPIGSDNTTYDGHKQKIKKVCANPFYILSVQSDLTVKACSCDVFRLHTVGDFNKNSLKEIWEGDELFSFRKKHLEGQTAEICSYCTFFPQQLDDIDQVADELLLKLQSRRE